MNNINKQQKPVILVLAGHDPSGGAGIQADIESISHAGCHASTVISCLTLQNTCEVIDIKPQLAADFKRQIDLILQDMRIAACKIGLLGSKEIIDATYEVLTGKSFPIVLDPIISAGSGKTLSDHETCDRMISKLIPITTIITPNSNEARILTDQNNLLSAAEKLMKYGAKNVLITGTHEDSDKVVNTLYSNKSEPLSCSWTRLPDNFHGSGCTLSSRIAAQLGLGKSVSEAVDEAQSYTWNTLNNGQSLGNGQKHPDRFFNGIKNEDA